MNGQLEETIETAMLCEWKKTYKNVSYPNIVKTCSLTNQYGQRVFLEPSIRNEFVFLARKNIYVCFYLTNI